MSMRCGVLIIGSLLWDAGGEGGRAAWRQSRLDASRPVPVRTPIRYGRRSQKRRVFTMVFSPGDELGHAVILPCRSAVSGIADLIEEATLLWQAEDDGRAIGPISSNWGSVGAIFAGDTALKADWAQYFAKAGRMVTCLGADGLLNIDWPIEIDGGRAPFDLLLATATVPAAERPTPAAIADAWIDRGDADYFFYNVKHGIRTPDDVTIWHRLEEQSPAWLRAETYTDQIEQLKRESQVRT